MNEKLFYGLPLHLLMRNGLKILLRKDGYAIMIDLLQRLSHLAREDWRQWSASCLFWLEQDCRQSVHSSLPVYWSVLPCAFRNTGVLNVAALWPITTTLSGLPLGFVPSIFSSQMIAGTLGTRGNSLAKSGRPNECEVRSERRERRAERE